MTDATTREGRVLLTGATGYVGGRLLRALEAQGRPVRCLVRRAGALAGRTGPHTEIAVADLVDDDPAPAMAGVDCAYYLVHSLGDTGDFEAREARAARRFADAAKAAGVRRIVYLGGLSDDRAALSPHLRSRHEVGAILRASGVPTIEFRASIIIGSGSLSYELIRALVRRLPVMIGPRWVRTPAQPIAIDDVIAYLVSAVDATIGGSRVFEIGGADVMSYADLLQEYARQRGLRRWVLPVPVLTPGLSSLWLHLVTPFYVTVGRKLIDSMRHPSIVRDHAALEVFPVRPMGVSDAIALATRKEDQEVAETHWADALSTLGKRPAWGGVSFRSRIVDSRAVSVPVDATRAFAPIRRIGGRQGWYYADGLWKIRGLVDRFFGGVGLGRGRRDPDELRIGDVLDWWRVEDYQPGRKLLLYAEMKVPGRAWLEFEVTPEPGGGCSIRQTALFDPLGLLGLAYWYSLYPLHQLIFAGMLREIGARAQSES